MRHVPLLAFAALAAAASGATAAPARAPACPKGHALAARTRHVLHLTKDDLVDAHCAVGRFPDPGWALLVRAYEHARPGQPDAATGVSIQVAVVDRAGAAVPARRTVIDQDLPVHVDDDDHILSLEAVDFDGDGTDELVYLQSTFQGGATSRDLHVLRLQAGAWKDVFTDMIAYDNADSGEPKHVKCAATMRITAAPGHRRVIVLAPIGRAPKSDSCITKREVWRPDATGVFVLAPK